MGIKNASDSDLITGFILAFAIPMLAVIVLGSTGNIIATIIGAILGIGVILGGIVGIGLLVLPTRKKEVKYD